MQNWIEIIKAIGPYATAIIASSLTAWFTRRNWIKQFGTEKSFLLTQEKIHMLREIPPRLINAVLVSCQSLFYRAMWETLARIISEQGKPSKDDHAQSHAIVEKYNEANDKLNQMWIELSYLHISSQVYFGSATQLAMEAFISSLKAMFNSDELYSKLKDSMYEIRSRALDGKVRIDEIIPELSVQGQQIMATATEKLRISISQVVQCMANDLKNSL